MLAVEHHTDAEPLREGTVLLISVLLLYRRRWSALFPAATIGAVCLPHGASASRCGSKSSWPGASHSSQGTAPERQCACAAWMLASARAAVLGASADSAVKDGATTASMNASCRWHIVNLGDDMMFRCVPALMYAIYHDDGGVTHAERHCLFPVVVIPLTVSTAQRTR